jgi:hypothetical protein
MYCKTICGTFLKGHILHSNTSDPPDDTAQAGYADGARATFRTARATRWAGAQRLRVKGVRQGVRAVR